MSTKRLFIALPIPDQLILLVRDWSQQLQIEIPFRKWIHPANYHITLKFLGETSIDTISPIKERLHFASIDIKPFELTLNGLGCFGSPTAPSVLWAGIKGDIIKLSQLHKSVELAMEAIGFIREERVFHPHISLARHFRGNTKMNQKILPSLSDLLDDDSVSWHANHFNLYSSSPGFESIYKVVDTFEL